MSEGSPYNDSNILDTNHDEVLTRIILPGDKRSSSASSSGKDVPNRSQSKKSKNNSGKKRGKKKKKQSISSNEQKRFKSSSSSLMTNTTTMVSRGGTTANITTSSQTYATPSSSMGISKEDERWEDPEWGDALGISSIPAPSAEGMFAVSTSPLPADQEEEEQMNPFNAQHNLWLSDKPVKSADGWHPPPTQQFASVGNASTATEQLCRHERKRLSTSDISEQSVGRLFKIAVIFVVTAAVGIGIGAVVGVVVYLAIPEDNEVATVAGVPTISPSLAPTFVSTDILLAAGTLSHIEALVDSRAPQFQAVSWMSSFDEVYTVGLDRLGFAQRYAFIVMYFSFHGENWINQEQWLTPNLHECEWSTSMVCGFADEDPLQVTDFDAPANNLKGTVPREIGLLTSCKSFRIPRNNVRGTIPISIGSLTALLLVDMSDNRLTGSIPPSLVDAQNLMTVDLSKNQLSSSIPVELYNLKLLRTLSLTNNKISGSLSESIGNLTSLVVLDLRNNYLTGTFPLSLDTIQSINIIRLDYNQLTGKLPQVTASLSRMHTVSISHNFFSGNMEVHPSYFTSNVDPADHRLQHVDLSYNLLSGPISPLFGFLPSFRYLDLSGNGFVGTFPSNIDWAKMDYLAAANNGLTGTVPVGYPSLTHLDFSNNFFTEQGVPQELCDYPNLELLVLSGNPLQSSSIPSCLANVPSLRVLELASCSLTGTIPPKVINGLTDLSILNISSNLLTGVIPSEIGYLTNLQKLELQKNSLSGTIPSGLANMVDLKTLNLNSNHLTGTFPAELEALVQLGSLLLWGNSGLQGEISVVLCNLSGLEILAEDIGCSIICKCCIDNDMVCGGS